MPPEREPPRGARSRPAVVRRLRRVQRARLQHEARAAGHAAADGLSGSAARQRASGSEPQLPSRRARCDLHHASAESGFIRWRSISDPHLQVEPGRQSAWYVRAQRPPVGRVWRHAPVRLPFGKCDLCGGVAQLARAKANHRAGRESGFRGSAVS